MSYYSMDFHFSMAILFLDNCGLIVMIPFTFFNSFLLDTVKLRGKGLSQRTLFKTKAVQENILTQQSSFTIALKNI